MKVFTAKHETTITKKSKYFKVCSYFVAFGAFQSCKEKYRAQTHDVYKVSLTRET